MDLDTLEGRLEAAISSGTELRLQANELDLPVLPEMLWPSGGLKIESISYQRISATELLIEGTIELSLLGRGTVRLIAQPAQDPPVRTELSLANSARLAALLDAILPPLDVAKEVFERIQAKAVQWEIPKAGALDVRLDLEGAYEASLAGLSLRLMPDKGRFRFDSAASDVDLTGRIAVGNLESQLIIQVENGKVAIGTHLPELNLRSLASLIGLSLPAFPGLDLLDRALGGLEILFHDGAPMLVFRYDTPLGPSRCLVIKEAGDWAVIAGLHSEALRFSQLNGTLAPLDALTRIIAFGDPVISFADRDLTSVLYPFPNGAWSAHTFQKGVKVNGELLLDDQGLELFGTLFGLKRLPLSVPIGTDWSQLRLAATLDRQISFLGDCAVLHRLSIAVAPDPFRASLSGEVRITLFGAELPPFILGGNLSPADASLFLSAAGVWSKPLGLPVSVQDLTFQISSKPSYGIAGRVALRDRALDVAMEFVAQVPTFFAGQLDGEMPLGNILFDLLEVDLLPSFFQPTIKDFHLYIVPNPAGASVGTRVYPFGLSARGTLSLFGMGFVTDLHLSKTQVRAIGELDGPIRIDPVFRLTGVERPAPSLRVDTAGEPLASLDGRMRFMGMEQSVNAALSSSGFSAKLEEHVGGAHAKLTVTLGDRHVQAAGDIACKVTGSIGPIRLLGGGPDLGTIRIDTGAELTTTVRLEFDGGFAMRVQGRITIVGISTTLPSFTVAIASLEDLPAALLAYLRDHIIELLADVWSDVDRWLRAVAEKLIEGVEDVARTLKEHFQQGSREIADAMLGVLRHTLDQTAQALKGVGETAERIGRIFRDLGHGDAQIAAALKAAAFAPEVIGNALRELGNGVEAIGTLLKDAGFDDGVVDLALRAVFPGIPGVGWPPHIKHVKLPHVKHVKLPHVKHVKLPHVKHVKLPHVKHIKIF
jgi:hypothetical protein